MHLPVLLLPVIVLLKQFVSSEVVFDENPDASNEWWKHATFYQIYPRSYMDSDGDGMGDLQGIIRKMDHLVDAGVTATWLSPIFKSPGADAGYDISDFRSINESFGTMEDFEELLQKANELGIKIILDFVPNHSSDEHEWFVASLNGTEGYEDYYVWEDGTVVDGIAYPPNNWISNFGGSAWTYIESRGMWYYHAFLEQQPDLNYRNPKVVQEMKDVLVYWLDKGVHGFRIDAIPCLFEDIELRNESLSDGYDTYDVNDYNCVNHIYTNDRPETFDMVYQWRAVIDNYTQQSDGIPRVIMTEAYVNFTYTMLYYGNETMDGAHFNFNFFIISNINENSTSEEIVYYIKEWFAYMPTKYVANWVIGNHDRDRAPDRLGKNNMDGYNMLVTLLPGVAVTYYGEEIGMENGEVTWEQGQDNSACKGKEEDFASSSRDFERTPMHWDNTTNAGFSTANQTWLPVSEKYRENNLLFQKAFGVRSHYHIYQELMQLRKLDTFTYGNLNIEVIDTYVFAFTRELTGNDTYIYVFNHGHTSVTVDLSYFTSVGSKFELVVANVNSRKMKSDIFAINSVELDPHEAIVGKSLSTSTEPSGASYLTTLSVFVTVFFSIVCYTLL